jgi:hypothetical protein
MQPTQANVDRVIADAAAKWVPFRAVCAVNDISLDVVGTDALV